MRFVPDSEALIGDLIEEFAHGRSHAWVWRQSFAAVIDALRHRTGEIRPLRLLDQQPLDAIERTLAMQRRRRDVSPTPNPLPASIGLVIVGGLVTALAPVMWIGLLITFVGGVGLAAVLAAAHKRQQPPAMGRKLK
jgi:hypothetical protein